MDSITSFRQPSSAICAWVATASLALAGCATASADGGASITSTYTGAQLQQLVNEAHAKYKEGNMLVLSRKPMERIQIGDSVVVTVLEIRGKNARIGIEAPKEIHVLRTELQNAISERPTGRVPAGVASIES